MDGRTGDDGDDDDVKSPPRKKERGEERRKFSHFRVTPHSNGDHLSLASYRPERDANFDGSIHSHSSASRSNRPSTLARDRNVLLLGKILPGRVIPDGVI